MSSNVESPGRDFGYSSQLTIWILDSGATCHMTPDISDFLPRSLIETDKYFEVSNEHYITAKQTGKLRIRMHNNNGKPLIDTLYNVLFTPDLCDQLFYIITLIHLGHT